MNNIRAFILVCLVVGASASLNPFSKTGDNYDLDGLEKWLNKQSATKYEPDADIALIKGAFNRFKVQRTAQLLIDIVDSESCNQQVLVNIGELAKARLFHGAYKRAEKLLLKPLMSLYDKCGQFVDETVGSLLESSLSDEQKEFVKLLEDSKIWHAVKNYISRPFPAISVISHLRESMLWNHFFFHLTKEDPRAQVLERKQLGQTEEQHKNVFHRDAFNYAMQKYLVEPCQSLTATLKDKFNFDALFDVTKLNSAGGYYTGDKSFEYFLSHRPEPVKRLTYEYLFCAELAKSGRNFDDIFEIVNKY